MADPLRERAMLERRGPVTHADIRPRRWLAATVLALVTLGSLVVARGAVADTTFTYVKIADYFTPIPGGTGTFTLVGQPGLAGGVVTFIGGGSGGQSGIYARAADGSTSLAVLYDRSTPRPGTTELFSQFDRVSISQSGIAFRSNGIYSDVGGTLHAVATANTPIPGGTGTFSTLGRPWVGSGVVVFRGLGSSEQDGIYAYSGGPGGTLRRVADTTTPVPGGTGTFVNFGQIFFGEPAGVPAVQDGVIVFRGAGSAGEHGIYKEENGALHVVADLTTPIPGGLGTFTDFGFSILSGNVQDGTIVFVGSGAGGQAGIYLHDGTSLSVVVDRSMVAPGTASSFNHFAAQGMGFDGGHVSFLADAGATQAVFATLGGVLRTVVPDGIVLPDTPPVSPGQPPAPSGAFGTYGRGIEGNMIAFNVGHFGGVGGANFVAIASNDPPAAGDDALTVQEDGVAAVDVLANDTDPDGDVLTVGAVTQGAHGTVSCTGAGVCRYAATTASFSGADSFTYTVTDGRGGSAVGTVDVTITPVDDADVSVAVSASPDPAGRGRLLTYTIVARNAGPETARSVVVSDVLPTGTTFASATTKTGTVKTPPVGAAGTVLFAVGALAARASATMTLTVNVTSKAPADIVNVVSIAHGGTDPRPANDTARTTTGVIGAGTFALKQRHRTVRAGAHARLALEWTVPGASWHELKDLEVRIRDAQETVLWIRLLEGDAALLAVSDHGAFGTPKPPGRRAVLKGDLAKVHLAGTSVKANGVTDPSVVVSLDLTFKERASGGTYVIEVRASDDFGNVDDWQPAGTLTVKPR
jgi:uncharacterized repeat protein (TIGR01451 family)